MSEDPLPYAEPLKFSCLVAGHRVALHEIQASGSGWRCSCREFNRPREGDPPSCGHIERAFGVWWRRVSEEGVTEAKWY